MKVQLIVGEFEATDKRGLTACGKEKYTVQILMHQGKMKIHACVAEDGNSMTIETGDVWEKMDEDAIKEMENMVDPADAYSHHYKLQPENQGKIIWVTGG